MKKWLKWLSLILIGVLGAAIFSSCGTKKVEDNYCTVKFELCTDLQTNNIMDQEVAKGETVMKPIVAVIGSNPDNREVDSWYTDANYTTKWNFLTDTVTKDMTLYAKWIGKYNINYYLGDNTETPMFSRQVREGEILEASTELADGYRSNGFFTSPDYTEEFEFGKPVTKEENIYIHRSDEFYFSGDMIARRFTAVAASSGAGSQAGSISVAGEGDDRYAVANFGYSTAADPHLWLKNVTVDISKSQTIRITFKNMGPATSLKFYFVAWFDDETKEYVDKQFFSEPASYLHRYSEEQMNMTAEDDWLVLDFNIAEATIRNGVSLWGNASTLVQLRVQSSYVSESPEDLSNELWIKSIEGISDPTYVNSDDSDAVVAILADDAAEKVQAAGDAQPDVDGWIFPKNNNAVSTDNTIYQKENGLLFYSEFRKQNATLILRAENGKSIDLDKLTTLTFRLKNYGYATSFDITYRNKSSRSATQTVVIDARADGVKEYKLNMFGANNWNGLLDSLMITYNSVGNDNAILFESIIFSDFEVVQLHGLNFNDKYTFGLESNDAMEVSYSLDNAGTVINVINSESAIIEKTYDATYTIYGYSALTLNYKANAEGITKVIVGLTINDVETLYNFDISVEETSLSLPLEVTGNVQKVRVTFNGTGEIILKDIRFELDKASSLNFATGDFATYVTEIRKDWSTALAFDANMSASIHTQSNGSSYTKYYFGVAKGEQKRGEGNISLEGKSKIVLVYQNTGVACNFQIAVGFVNMTEDESWRTAHTEPYTKGMGGGTQFQSLRGEMTENEWDYVEFDLLKYDNISEETINEKALAVIMMEFSDSTLNTSIKIRAISII